jgi:hypothetical protein
VFRTEEDMAILKDKLAAYRGRFAKVRPAGQGHAAYNLDLIEALELGHMLDVCEASARAPWPGRNRAAATTATTSPTVTMPTGISTPWPPEPRRRALLCNPYMKTGSTHAAFDWGTHPAG